MKSNNNKLKANEEKEILADASKKILISQTAFLSSAALISGTFGDINSALSTIGYSLILSVPTITAWGIVYNKEKKKLKDEEKNIKFVDSEKKENKKAILKKKK